MSSGESADVRVDSERRRWPDGLWSASVSYGWMGRHRFWPDSKHTAMEVSLREGWWSGCVRDEVTESTNYTLCFSVPHYGEAKLVPISITDQPSEHETCISFFFFLFFFFSYSLSLSLFLSIVWVNWESYRITAWQFLPVVWFLIITFIFLFWKKKTKKLQGNNSPNKNDIDISEKLQDQLHKLLLYHCIIIRL